MNVVEKLDLAIKLKEIGTMEGFYTVPYKGGTLHKSTYMKTRNGTLSCQLCPKRLVRSTGKAMATS